MWGGVGGRPNEWARSQLLAFQGWLKALADALVQHKKLAPQLKDVVATLMHDYVQAADQPPGPHSSSSARLPLRLWSTLPLAFCYLGCMYLREAVGLNPCRARCPTARSAGPAQVTAEDLAAWARSRAAGAPFLGYWRSLSPRLGATIRPRLAPSGAAVHNLAAHLALFLALDLPPGPTPLP